MSHVKTIALTRPLEDSLAMAKGLEAQGMRVFVVPMLHIEYETGVVVDEALAENFQAICVTSRHAVRGLGNYAHPKQIKLYAVGRATAAAARAAGFTEVYAAEESAASLLELVKAQCIPGAGTILYARGRDITLDLSANLNEAGYIVKEAVLYRAELVDELPQDFMHALNTGGVDEVHFYSRRSAENYMRLVERHELEAAHTNIAAVCISKAVAETTGQYRLKWQTLYVY